MDTAEAATMHLTEGMC